MNYKEKYGKVAVIMGGTSPEREISLISGTGMLEAYLRLGVDAYKFDPAEKSICELKNMGFDRAILAMHGKGGEDGTLQGALEYLKIPYSGSGVMASSIAMDKHRTKLIWQSLGLPVAKWQYLREKDYRRGNFKLQLELPVIIKPAREGSTIGITKLYVLDKLEEAIELAFKSDTALLIEELIIGDEFSATISKDKVYPIVKIEAPNKDYDYKNKYFTDDTKYICPWNFSKLQNEVEKLALECYLAVGANGIARIDFMIDKNEHIYFLEINTLPGMTSHSLTPIAFKAVGVSYDELCLYILDEASCGK